ncbi:hypothetical protein PR048_015452 [Dryococelus australis]|uniref:Uncharacterized protein n=1 Tax=Dryococelus australis TaxID=614101 RepID=A0ABQ9HH03_9NEOP|nr:hypothetical protein PR048_015452 [Dryococelus australis]
MRVKRGDYGAATECKGGGNGRYPRKPADQRYRPARFPHGKIRRNTVSSTSLMIARKSQSWGGVGNDSEARNCNGWRSEGSSAPAPGYIRILRTTPLQVTVRGEKAICSLLTQRGPRLLGCCSTADCTAAHATRMARHLGRMAREHYQIKAGDKLARQTFEHTALSGHGIIAAAEFAKALPLSHRALGVRIPGYMRAASIISTQHDLQSAWHNAFALTFCLNVGQILYSDQNVQTGRANVAKPAGRCRQKKGGECPQPLAAMCNISICSIRGDYHSLSAYWKSNYVNIASLSGRSGVYDNLTTTLRAMAISILNENRAPEHGRWYGGGGGTHPREQQCTHCNYACQLADAQVHCRWKRGSMAGRAGRNWSRPRDDGSRLSEGYLAVATAGGVGPQLLSGGRELRAAASSHTSLHKPVAYMPASPVGTPLKSLVNSALRYTLFNIPMRAIEVNMERHRNEGVGETGDPRGNPSTNGIVQHDFHLQKSGDPAGDRTRLALEGTYLETPFGEYFTFMGVWRLKKRRAISPAGNKAAAPATDRQTADDSVTASHVSHFTGSPSSYNVAMVTVSHRGPACLQLFSSFEVSKNEIPHLPHRLDAQGVQLKCNLSTALLTNSQCDKRTEHLSRRDRGADPRPSDYKSALHLRYQVKLKIIKWNGVERFGRFLTSRSVEPMRVKRGKYVTAPKARARESGDLQENPPTSGIASLTDNQLGAHNTDWVRIVNCSELHFTSLSMQGRRPLRKRRSLITVIAPTQAEIIALDSGGESLPLSRRNRIESISTWLDDDLISYALLHEI